MVRIKTGAINLAQPVNLGSPLNRGLVSWWFPNQNPKLDLCNKNHGTFSNGLTWSSGRNGLGELRFDGTDDAVDFTLTSFFPRDDGSFSIMLMPTVASGIRQIFMWRINGSNEIGLVDFNGTFGLNLGCQYNATVGRNVSAPSLTINKWSHITVTWNTTQTQILRMYIDGIEVGTAATGLGGMSSSDPLYYRIGGSNSPSENFQGYMKSARLYKYTLSSNEVLAHYQDALLNYPQTLNRLSRTFIFDVTAGGGGNEIYYRKHYPIFKSFIRGY